MRYWEQFNEVIIKEYEHKTTFDVRSVRNNSKRLYILANFGVYQILRVGRL